jgi:hypothetical protein
MPFPLLGFDTDNDSVFINETVQSYCKEAGVEFTRCRHYRKNARTPHRHPPPREWSGGLRWTVLVSEDGEAGAAVVTGPTP